MNDFTKDELKRIENRLNRTQLLSDDPLINKIKSLIDNYCDHHWRTSAIDAIYCPKCQKHVDYEI